MAEMRGRGGVVASCRELPENGRDGGKGRSDLKLSQAARKGQKRGEGELLS